MVDVPDALRETARALRERVAPVDGDWHRRGRLAVLALAVVAFAAGGVQIADPSQPATAVDPVDADASPARIAHQAMRQPAQGSYVLERSAGKASERHQQLRLRVDAPDRQVRGTVTFDPEVTVAVYGSDAGTWRRPEGASGWTYASPASRLPVLFGHEAAVLAEDAAVSIVARNASTVVVRVNDTDTAALLARGWENVTGSRPGARASLTLAVDRETGRLTRSRFRWSIPDDDEDDRMVRVVVHRFSRWGAVDVAAPPGLPYSFDAALFDLVDYCPDCEEGNR